MPRASNLLNLNLPPPTSAIVPPNLSGPALRTMRPLRFVPVALLGAVQLPAPGPTPIGQKLHVDPANFVPVGQEPPGARVAGALYQCTISVPERNFGSAGAAMVLSALTPSRAY